MQSYRPISKLSTLKTTQKTFHPVVAQISHDIRAVARSTISLLANHSTLTAVMNILDDILVAVESNILALLTFLDLSVAFGSIDHAILLLNESYYGLRSSVHGWFVSYHYIILHSLFTGGSCLTTISSYTVCSRVVRVLPLYRHTQSVHGWFVSYHFTVKHSLFTGGSCLTTIPLYTVCSRLVCVLPQYRRTQSVHCRSSSTTPTVNVCGVSQGSVIGPNPFLLYTADLLRLIKTHGLRPYLFADPFAGFRAACHVH